MTTLTGSGLLALAVAASSRLRPLGGPRILMRISKPSAGARMRRAMARGPLAASSRRRRSYGRSRDAL